MENPFKKIGIPPKEVPEGLKRKVMDDVDSYLLYKEVATLFTSNYSSAIESFFKERKKK